MRLSYVSPFPRASESSLLFFSAGAPFSTWLTQPKANAKALHCLLPCLPISQHLHPQTRPSSSLTGYLRLPLLLTAQNTRFCCFYVGQTTLPSSHTGSFTSLLHSSHHSQILCRGIALAIRTLAAPGAFSPCSPGCPPLPRWGFLLCSDFWELSSAVPWAVGGCGGELSLVSTFSELTVLPAS